MIRRQICNWRAVSPIHLSTNGGDNDRYDDVTADDRRSV